MKIHIGVIAGLFSLASTNASATDDANRTISTIGAQTSTSAFVQFKEGTSAGCLSNAVFLGDMSQPIPKAMLALLLAAQARGAVVADISYDKAGNGSCIASMVQIQ